MSEITIDSFVIEQAKKLRKVINEKPEFETELWNYVEAGKEEDIIKIVESAVGTGTDHLLTAHHTRNIIDRAYQLATNYDKTFEKIDPQTLAKPSDTQ